MRAGRVTSAADLKFLRSRGKFDQELQIEAALADIELFVPFAFRSSCKGVLQRDTNFGKRAQT
jgi:hypothetical protein